MGCVCPVEKYPARDYRWDAWASRLCAALPPWAALYVLFQFLTGV